MTDIPLRGYMTEPDSETVTPCPDMFVCISNFGGGKTSVSIIRHPENDPNGTVVKTKYRRVGGLGLPVEKASGTIEVPLSQFAMYARIGYHSVIPIADASEHEALMLVSKLLNLDADRRYVFGRENAATPPEPSN